jgi:AbiU2
MSRHTSIDRVTFLNPNMTVFEVHSVPIGVDAKTCARDWVEREQRAGRPSRSYSIERDSGRMKGGAISNRSADEAKTANIGKMGEPLGALYSALWQSVSTIHFYWKEYVELFGTKPERIDLLNRAAPAFFRMLQDELWENSLLHLARLTDPANSPGKQAPANLTIQALAALVTDAKLKETVSTLVAEAVKQTEFCRDWRNRHIAHRDLKLALEQPTQPLAEGSRADVKAALKALTDVLNAIEGHYFQSETRFDLGARLGGASSLLHVLDDGLRAQEARQRRFEEGKPLKDDVIVRDL